MASSSSTVAAGSPQPAFVPHWTDALVISRTATASGKVVSLLRPSVTSWHEITVRAADGRFDRPYRTRFGSESGGVCGPLATMERVYQEIVAAEGGAK